MTSKGGQDQNQDKGMFHTTDSDCRYWLHSDKAFPGSWGAAAPLESALKGRMCLRHGV